MNKKKRQRNQIPGFAWLIFGLLISVAALYLCSMLYHTGGHPVSPLDDSYIFFQYASQLAQGEPMKYNTSDPSTLGVSSPLYMLLLSLPALFGITGDGMVLVGFVLGLAFFALSVVLMYRLAFNVSGDVAAARLAALFFTLSGLVAWHYLSGMDTGMFATCVLLFVLLVQREGEEKKRRGGSKTRAYLAALIVVLPLARPEGVVVIAAYLTYLAVRKCWGRLARRALAAVLALALFLGFNLLVGGQLAPSSAAPKSAVFAAGMGPFDLLYSASAYLGAVFKGLLAGYFGAQEVGYMGGSAAWNEVTLYLPPFFLLLSLLGLSALGGKGRNGVSFFYALALLYHLVFLSVFLPLGWHHHRYIFPLLPPLLAFGAAGICSLRGVWGGRGRAFSNWLAAFCLVFFLASLLNFASLYGRNAHLYYKDHYRVSEYVRENLPVDVPICAADIGIIKYRTGNYVVDLKGIISPWLGEAARSGTDALLAGLKSLPLEKRPRYALLQRRPDFKLESWLKAGYLEEMDVLPATGSASEMKIYRVKY